MQPPQAPDRGSNRRDDDIQRLVSTVGEYDERDVRAETGHEGAMADPSAEIRVVEVNAQRNI